GGDVANYFGTFADGLLMRREGHWLQTTTTEGLPSNRVIGIGVIGEQVYAGTDFGIVQLDKIDAGGEKITARVMAMLPGLSSLVAYDRRVYVSLENGEVFSFEPEPVNAVARLTLNPVERHRSATRGSKLRIVDDNLFLLTDSGIWVATERGKR